MPERTNGAALKAARPFGVSWVRIPVPPLHSSDTMAWELQSRAARHDRPPSGWPSIAAAVAAVVPPLALLLIMVTNIDPSVPAVPFYAAGTAIEIAAAGLAVWGIVRATRGAGLLWLAILSLILAVPGAAFFGLGTAISYGFS
jgi:hypothetical protein